MDIENEYQIAEQYAGAFSASSSQIVNGITTFELNHLNIRFLSYHRTILQRRYSVFEHEHPNYEISFIRKGAMVTTCESHRIAASEEHNQIFFVPPLTFHSRVFGDTTCNVNETMMIMIQGVDEIGHSLCRLLPAAIREKGYSFPFSPPLQTLSDLYEARILSSPDGKDTAMALLKAWFGTFLHENFPDFFAPAQLKKYSERLDVDLAGNRIDVIKNAIENSFVINKPLHYCEQRLNMSLRHLNRIFKADTGMTLNQYLSQRKLSAAEEMLISTQASVNEIAAAVGFSSQEQFAVFFRKHHRCTPTEFRNAHQKSDINYL